MSVLQSPREGVRLSTELAAIIPRQRRRTGGPWAGPWAFASPCSAVRTGLRGSPLAAIGFGVAVPVLLGLKPFRGGVLSAIVLTVMIAYIRAKILFIAQLQGVAGTDVPEELRPWPKVFIDACRTFACQQGLREVRVAKASTLASYPSGHLETLSEGRKKAL